MFWQSLPRSTRNRSKAAMRWVVQRFPGKQEIDAQDDASPFRATRYRLPLFEHKQAWLHVLELRQATPVKRLLVIEQQFDRSADRFTLIDGTGPTLTSLAAQAGGIAEGCEGGYLEFFCACLLAVDGNFVIARERLEPSPLVGFKKEIHDQRVKYLGPGAAAEDRQREAATISKVNEEIGKIWRVRKVETGLALAPVSLDAIQPGDEPAPRHEQWEGILFYGNGAFKGRLKLDRRTGMVDMLDDDPIAELGKDLHTGTARRDAPGQPPFFVEPVRSIALAATAMHPEEAQKRLRETGLLQDVIVESRLTLGSEASSPNPDTLVLERVSIRGDLELPGSLTSSLVIRECVILGCLIASDSRVRGNLTIENTKVWGLHDLPPEGTPGWVRRVVDFEGTRIDGALIATRLTIRGSLWAPKLTVGSHTDLRGLHVLPPYAIERDEHGDRKVRLHNADAANIVNFEQAHFGGSVDLGIHVRDRRSSFGRPGFRDAVVVGQLILNHARVEGSLWTSGLSVVSLPTERLTPDSAKPLTSLSAWGARIQGSLLCHLSDSDSLGSGVNLPPLRLVVGAALDFTGATIGGFLDLRIAYIGGDLMLSGICCEWVSFDGMHVDPSNMPSLSLFNFPLREFLAEPSVQLTFPSRKAKAEKWPVATVRGDLTLFSARVRHGITCTGTQIHGAVTIVGGEIGGFRVKPHVLKRRDAGCNPKWIRTRIGSFLAKDLRFTQRIHLFGAVFSSTEAGRESDHAAAPAPEALPVKATRPRPAMEVNNCFINGGIYFSDPRIYDDRRSFEEKAWAYRWAGFETVEDLETGKPSGRLRWAERIRTRRGRGDAVHRNRLLVCDLLASLFDGDVEVVNCELDGDFDFTNAAIDGYLRLTDSMVRADIRAAPFSEEPPRGTWTRAAHCSSLGLDTTTCEGDVDLSGCCVRPQSRDEREASAGSGGLSARGAIIRGDLCLMTASGARVARLFTAENRVDLTDARCGRMLMPPGDSMAHMARGWSIEGLHVGSYALGAHVNASERDAVLALLDKADFAPQAYVNYERSLVDSGSIEDADHVYRSLKKRRWKQDSGGWSLLRLVWETLVYKWIFGGLMGYGTRFLRPLLYFVLTLAVAMGAVWNPIDVQPSSARLAAAEAGARSAQLRSACPDDWDITERLWLAVHYAVPIVSLVDAGDWEPRESPPAAGSPCAVSAAGEDSELARLKRGLSPKNIANVIATLNWILLPVFLLGVTARIQRRRD
jgi:hypothetical protein